MRPYLDYSRPGVTLTLCALFQTLVFLLVKWD